MLIRFLKISSIIVLILCSVNLAQECKAKVHLNCIDKDAQFFLNSNIIGEGSVDHPLEKGKYEIIVKKKYAWNSPVIIDTILIDDCAQKYSFDYSFTKDITLESTPADAKVYSKNELLGYTPISVQKNQLNDISVSYRGENRKLSNASPVRIIEYDKPVMNENHSFVKSNLFQWLLGSAVVLGTATAYFKLQADKKYDDYKLSKNNSTLDEIDRYDLYSGISLGLLQINFGYLIYRFLSD